MMKAAYVLQPGPAETLTVGEMPTPSPGPGQILVRVAVSAVNPIDTYVRSGAVAMPLPSPFVPGSDFAGVVAAAGPGAQRFKVGDKVWGSNQGLLGRQGTLAEYVAVDEALAYPLPEGVDPADAAATALVGITAHLGLFRDARLQPGETLFVNGGSGGVGSVVVQMAKQIGARVITTAGSEDNATRCRELGADAVINYKTEDVAARVKELAPAGLQVFWETLREPNFDQAVELLAPRGRMILMAGRDARPPFPVGPFYVKNLVLTGFVMFLASPEEQQQCAADINRWLAAKQLRPQIGRRFALDQAAAAHRLQEDNTIHKAGTNAGKILVEP